MTGEGYINILYKINRVLHKLKDSSAELNEVERIVTELKSDVYHSSDDIKDRSDLLLVSGILRDMLNVLKTGLEGIPAKQRMQMAIQGIMLTEDRTSEEDSTRSKRVKLKAQVKPNNVCMHTCIHHPEVVNPGLWSKLGEDLVGQVFARLPIPRIIELRKCFEAWSALSDSPSFKGAFMETNPKLLGLLGWDSNMETLHTTILDVKDKEWHDVELDFPKGYGNQDSWCACDGGLACFLPRWGDKSEDELEGYIPDSIYVCNPLTNTWKKLPDIPSGFGNPILVQLVTDSDTRFYRVILVYREKLEDQDVQPFGAFVYDSKTESWSVMNSGLVYGSGDSLMDFKDEPLLFDCATKRLFHLNSCPSLRDAMPLLYSILKDRLCVLHARINPDSTKMFVISEYTWESNTSNLKKLKDYEASPDFGSYEGGRGFEILTSTGFILSTWDKLCKNWTTYEVIRIYDKSAGQWLDLPPVMGLDPRNRRNANLRDFFMCELRWDAIP